MAVDLSPIDESLLAEIANIHGMPKGAFNIRKDGQLVERSLSLLQLDRKNIESRLKNKGLTPNEVFLMTLDDCGNTFIQTKEGIVCGG